jgi:hypothetical protein
MGRIREAQHSSRDEVKELLTEMFPKLKEEILFAYKEDFQEWFGMIFEMHKWMMYRDPKIVVKDLILLDSRVKEVENDLTKYEDVSPNHISVVEINGKRHLVDGFHRIGMAKKKSIETVSGVLWVKVPNPHGNCFLLKKELIKYL